jgi:hypothetical protein
LVVVAMVELHQLLQYQEITLYFQLLPLQVVDVVAVILVIIFMQNLVVLAVVVTKLDTLLHLVPQDKVMLAVMVLIMLLTMQVAVAVVLAQQAALVIVLQALAVLAALERHHL